MSHLRELLSEKRRTTGDVLALLLLLDFFTKFQEQFRMAIWKGILFIRTIRRLSEYIQGTLISRSKAFATEITEENTKV